MTKNHPEPKPSLSEIVNVVYEKIKPIPDWHARTKIVDSFLLTSMKSDIAAGRIDNAAPDCSVFITALLHRFGQAKIHCLPQAVLHLLADDEGLIRHGMEWIEHNSDLEIDPGTAASFAGSFGEMIELLNEEEYPGFRLVGGFIQTVIEADERDPIDEAIAVKEALTASGMPPEKVNFVVRTLAKANTEFEAAMEKDPELRRIFEELEAEES